MKTPLAIDLFCGAGGVALGLLRAGYRVVGVDIEQQPDYPAEFVLGDAYRPPLDLAQASLVWASPPCQAYTTVRDHARAKAPRQSQIPATRALLSGLRCPTVIESPSKRAVRPDLCLELAHFRANCGNWRRRYFEINGGQVPPPALRYPYRPCTVSISGSGHYGSQSIHHQYDLRRQALGLPYTSRVDEVEQVLGIYHIRTGGLTARRRRLNQALPPEYSEYIGRYLLREGI